MSEKKKDRNLGENTLGGVDGGWGEDLAEDKGKTDPGNPPGGNPPPTPPGDPGN